MMRAAIVLVLVLLSPLAVPPLACAQDAETAATAPSPDASDLEARARFESGRLAFEAGRYEEALADFTRSYELSQRGLILFNIGLVHDRLRRDGEALDAFERYLAAVPDAENRTEVESRIAVLRRALAERQQAPQPTTPMPMPDGPPPPAPSAASSQSLYEIGGWTATGIAVAAGIGAAVMWAVANDQYAQLDARCGAAGCPRSEIDASGAPGLVTGTNVLLVSAIVSALAAATAWTLYFVDVPTSSSTSLRIGPGSLRLTF